MAPISILEVERAWRKHPEGRDRAPGGRRALSGFNYQVCLSLSRFFRAVADGSQAGAFAFDGLSDLAERRADLIYLTQVKSTLSKEALKSAAAEALAVDRFLEDRLPELREAYRYQVVGRRKTPNLPEIAQISASDLALDGDEADRWIRVQERFDSISIQPDPVLDLAIFLFPRVHKTFSFIESATGRLFTLLGEDRPSAEIAQSLLKLWDESRTKASPPGEILGPHSWAAAGPEAPEAPLILVGERPTVGDVTAGRFMERPARVHGILREIHEALLEPSADLTTVLWLEGTSGAGKSVLLLQVLRELTMQEGYTVHWLQHFSHDLAEAFDYWQDQPVRAFLGVDDLFAPDHRNLPIWNAFYEAMARRDWPMGRPLLVTAGPFEYREAFEDQAHRQGSLAIRRILVDALRPTERDEARTWYSERTGWTAPTIREDNFVSHVFIYELHRLSETPDLRGFTARFKERLTELGILDAALSALALNRFGILAPEELFGHAAGALDQLQREGVLRARRLESATGVRLFHAAIAETLYARLRPAERMAERAGDLARAIASVLPDQERARALLDTFSRTKNRKKLGEELSARLGQELWRRVEGIVPPEVPIDLLFTLFEGYLDAIEPRARAVASRLRAWMAHEQMDAQGWGLLLQFLERIAPGEIGDEYLNKAETLLADQTEWPGWNYVWQAAWRTRPSSRLVDLALLWLPAHSDERAWGYVFQPLFEYDSALPGLDSIARSGLERSPVSPADPYLWKKAATLLEESDLAYLIAARVARTQNPRLHGHGLQYLFDEMRIDPDSFVHAMSLASGEDHYPLFLHNVLDARREEGLLDLGEAWLLGHEDQPAWVFIWQRLLELRPNDPDLVETGYRWLQDREDQPAWVFIWQRLLELRSNDADLVDIGYQWLRNREDRPEWNYVWKKLTELQPHNPDFVDTGYRWLQDREDQPAWSHVWERLLELRPNDLDLVDTGDRWLQGREERPEWCYVWKRLIKLRSLDADLIDTGHRWLQDREDRPEWNYIWKRLTELQPHDPDLVDTGYQWLNNREERPAWSHVWERLIELRPHDADLVDTGHQWLQNREDRLEWCHVWQRLLEARPNDADLIGIGYRWLQGREDQPEWAFIWQRLLELRPHDADLVDTGHRWLEDREDRKEWNYIWQKLFELRNDDPELLDIGHRWLQDREERPAWSHVWERLLELRPHDADLVDAGHRWLQDREDRPEWCHVWQRLFELRSTDRDLAERGLAWLDRYLKDPGWPWVWEKLVRHRGPGDALIELAYRWLVTNSDHPKSESVARRVEGSRSGRRRGAHRPSQRRS